jgi:hypothetical protein
MVFVGLADCVVVDCYGNGTWFAIIIRLLQLVYKGVNDNA